MKQILVNNCLDCPYLELDTYFLQGYIYYCNKIYKYNKLTAVKTNNYITRSQYQENNIINIFKNCQLEEDPYTMPQKCI